MSDRRLLVGGPLPLAPGLIDRGPARAAVRMLSALLNGYWYFARHLIG